MSELTDRIARILCSEFPGIAVVQAQAAAAAVADALQLTEEWAYKGRAHPEDDEDELDEWSCGHPIITGKQHGVVHEGFDIPVRRFVTPWSSVEEHNH